MSFILDALKKSDAERQKRSTPGFADIPESRDRRRPQRWLWVVGGLLAINLVAVIALLIRREPLPVAATPPDAEQTAAAPDTAPARTFSDIVAEARETQPQAARPQAAAPGRQASREEEPATSSEPPRSSAPAAPTATFESLRADGSLQMPDLHLDIHVYSDRPAERFVFINMKKYREDDALAEGPVVREIAPEGVILEHSGNVFLLPRE